MLRMVEWTESVSIREQLQEIGGPIVLINSFTVSPCEADQLIEAWSADAVWMKQQSGFISTQLHRGIAGSGVFVNYAIWESTGHFRAAFLNPEFQAKLTMYPPSAVASPHLFRKVAVPNVCVI